MMIVTLSVLLVLALLLCVGLKLQLEKSIKLLAAATELNKKLAIESIRQAISTKLNG